ncbi:unnamed protein product [Cylindrotheca closterium]|uniref:Uncharacterized protein n=1 Tax=Cylindrotheca closterium TaxID=2856 RepID=A0AAD2FPF3_9STRA|nr:unnamed protein product [Cylindrotheca closterium]
MPIDSKIGFAFSFKTSHIRRDLKRSTSATTVETELSFESSDTPEVKPRSILKNTSYITSNVDDSVETHFQAWMNPPISDSLQSRTPSRRCRRRRDPTGATPNKYDRVKTRFPGREDRKQRRPKMTRRRKQQPEKTVEEQWVKTSRFLL